MTLRILIWGSQYFSVSRLPLGACYFEFCTHTDQRTLAQGDQGTGKLAHNRWWGIRSFWHPPTPRQWEWVIVPLGTRHCEEWVPPRESNLLTKIHGKFRNTHYLMEIPESSENCRLHLGYTNFCTPKMAWSATNFSMKGFGYCKFFQNWAGVLTMSKKCLKVIHLQQFRTKYSPVLNFRGVFYKIWIFGGQFWIFEAK